MFRLKCTEHDFRWGSGAHLGSLECSLTDEFKELTFKGGEGGGKSKGWKGSREKRKGRVGEKERGTGRMGLPRPKS